MSAERHAFRGGWVSHAELAALRPRNVFFRQLKREALDCTEHRDRHILYRRRFTLAGGGADARIFITADDHYKLYINGHYVGEGPTPSYHFHYRYDAWDVTDLLTEGENVIAVHTLYQGLINRVWQSGDFRHGLLFDLEVDGRTVCTSDGEVRTAIHTAYTPLGVGGYDTLFFEEYDARAAEVGFERPDYDDSTWACALPHPYADHTLTPAETAPLVSETIPPVDVRRVGSVLIYDFGATYVGRLAFTAMARGGERIVIRLGQELDGDGRVRYRMRANCRAEEAMVCAAGASRYDPYDYIAFRYAEICLAEGVRVEGVHLSARHYPFAMRATLRPEYSEDGRYAAIFALAEHSLCYGTQEAVLDCMEREKGFYLGDGCYTALAHAVLTGDDAMLRKLIDDGFLSSRLTPTLMTCLSCSFMQEIAEYPLMLVLAVLWHYRLFGDREYLARNYQSTCALLDAYRDAYEREGLLCELDKWSVVEWPMPYRDGYEVAGEGEICHEPHVATSAWYLGALLTANRMAEELGLPPYRDVAPLRAAFLTAFYDNERHMFCDSIKNRHISMIGNVLPFGLGLVPDGECLANILAMIRERGITGVALFGFFPLLMGLVRYRRTDMLPAMLLDGGAWLRMLGEGATSTLEGWGKDTKWNTSLFHLTMAAVAVFLADIDLEHLFL